MKDEWVEYYLTDVTKSLKGKEVNVFIRWEQMTTIGPYYSGKKHVGVINMPDDFKNPN